MKINLQPVVSAIGGNIFGFEALPSNDGPKPWHDALEFESDYLISSIKAAASLLVGDRCLFVKKLSDNADSLDRLCGDISETASQRRLNPSKIVFEIPEESDYHINERYSILKKKGFKICIDDVGDDFHWLIHQMHLGPDFLKLRAISRIRRNEEGMAVIQGISTICSHLGIGIIAPGVDDFKDADGLDSVSYLQGRLYGIPQPAEHWQ